MDFVRTTLQFDWLDQRNLNRSLRTLKIPRERLSPALGKTRRGIRANRNRSAFLTVYADTFIKRSGLRSLQESLPPQDEVVELQLPRQLVARDLMGFYRKMHRDDIPARIRYDIDSAHLSFFVLDAGFGIMPEPKKVVDWASLKVQLFPQRKDAEFIRIYEIAPQTTFEETSSFEGEVDVNSDLSFSTPATVPWLRGGVKASGRGIYKTQLKFAKSTITASTNQNNVVSWQFKRSRVRGEDPRGLFQTAAIIGVPASYGVAADQLSDTISASYAVRVSVKGWVFRNLRKKDEKITIDFETIAS